MSCPGSGGLLSSSPFRARLGRYDSMRYTAKLWTPWREQKVLSRLPGIRVLPQSGVQPCMGERMGQLDFSLDCIYFWTLWAIRLRNTI